jgi:competence protein ComFB
MEEQVYSRINELYDKLKQDNASWLSCDCENCRLDTVSYVLNRIQPKYVVSGRGATYFSDVLRNSQLNADIDALGIEGIRLVNSAKRPYHNVARDKCVEAEVNFPRFDFPTFQGVVMDGSSFEPLSDAAVTLRLDGEIAEMKDITWANPCRTFKTSKGAYSFWVKSIPAEKDGELKKFPFTLEITAEGYAPVAYSFEVPLTSESTDKGKFNMTYALKIQDLFMFRADIENPME